MLRDVPHVKAFLALGFGGMMVTLAICTWVYPSFKARCGEARTEATREVWANLYGISDRSASAAVRTGEDLTDEMRRAAGEPVPAGTEGHDAMSTAVTSDVPDAAPSDAPPLDAP